MHLFRMNSLRPKSITRLKITYRLCMTTPHHRSSTHPLTTTDNRRKVIVRLLILPMLSNNNNNLSMLNLPMPKYKFNQTGIHPRNLLSSPITLTMTHSRNKHIAWPRLRTPLNPISSIITTMHHSLRLNRITCIPQSYHKRAMESLPRSNLR